jgi:hypothetical protein
MLGARPACCASVGVAVGGICATTVPARPCTTPGVRFRARPSRGSRGCHEDRRRTCAETHRTHTGSAPLPCRAGGDRGAHRRNPRNRDRGGHPGRRAAHRRRRRPTGHRPRRAGSRRQRGLPRGQCGLVPRHAPVERALDRRTRRRSEAVHDTDADREAGARTAQRDGLRGVVAPVGRQHPRVGRDVRRDQEPGRRVRRHLRVEERCRLHQER